jgi:hypothetical protein
MTEGSNHFPGNGSDEELESAAVLGAAAIQRLIADRNHLRSEVAAAKVAQERLHQQYIELGKTILSLLRQFDVTMREAKSGRSESNPAEAANTSKQFDTHGLPVAPRPVGLNGANGHHNGHELPLEP